MKTNHRFYFHDARALSQVPDKSIDLVVTSPPYPMIEMWDELFFQLNPAARKCFRDGDYHAGFLHMHEELGKVWTELYRVLKPGAFACINIGDATRSVGGNFQLFANHARVLHLLAQLGFHVLPLILWRKQTNAPNKFMGSGMLPAGAYPTLEHEYILIFRKGGKRIFSSQQDKENRLESAIFWEERNTWYADFCDFKGSRQHLERSHDPHRQRSAAFPFLLPFRLVNMYSVKGDTVLDPFLGTGTTAFAAMASGRNSIGYEIEPFFAEHVEHSLESEFLSLNSFNQQRLQAHRKFVEQCEKEKKPLKYLNEFYGFPVVTKQETKLKLPVIQGLSPRQKDAYEVKYE